MRCQAILYMAMFRYKKDTAIKYSRTLNEHFKVQIEKTLHKLFFYFKVKAGFDEGRIWETRTGSLKTYPDLH